MQELAHVIIFSPAHEVLNSYSDREVIPLASTSVTFCHICNNDGVIFGS